MKQKIEKKILSIGLILIGITAIIFAFLCFNNYFGWYHSTSYISRETYGGDAYTSIQNAAAATANNVKYLAYDVASIGNFFVQAMGYSLLIVGLCLLLVGITKAIPAFKKQKNIVSDEAEQKVENI